MKRTLLTARTVLTMDQQLRVFSPGYVVVEDSAISAVGEGAPPSQAYDETVDLGSHLLMPGLINCHTHTPMVLTRGMCEGVSLFTMDGFLNTLRRFEAVGDADMAAVSVRVSLGEMIRTGTTCFADQYFYADRIFEQVDAAGLRAVIAYGIVELGDEGARRRELALTESFLEMCAGHPRIQGWIGPHAYFVDNSLELIAQEIALARKYDAGFHIHFATSNEENDYCHEHYGCDAVTKMIELGVLQIPTLAAHSITVSEDDMQRLKAYPFRPVLAPSSAMRSGFPAAPVKAMRECGLNVVLGTDNVCSSNSYDMFGELGTAGKLIIHREQDVNAITPRELVSMATNDAARALGLEDRIGSLETGKRADIIALDMNDIGWAPVGGQDYYTQLVYSVGGHSVTHSMVDGRWLMKGRSLTTLAYPDSLPPLETANAELRRRLEQPTSTG